VIDGKDELKEHSGSSLFSSSTPDKFFFMLQLKKTAVGSIQLTVH
jgi:hypothetical protein